MILKHGFSKRSILKSKQVKSIFFQPYPYKFETIRDIAFYIYVGVFVTVFLIWFQPFGISEWHTSYKFLKLIGYGILSSVIPICLYYLRDAFNVRYNWDREYKVIHEVFWLILIIFSIGLGHLSYSYFLGIVPFKITYLLYSLLMVVSIGVFPVLGSIWIKYNKFKSLNVRQAALIDNKIAGLSSMIDKDITQLITFKAENGKDYVQTTLQTLLFIECIENYVQIVCIGDGHIKKYVLRGTMKFFENQCQSDYIMRCHRSFIVNLFNVNHINGNAQGYVLSFRDTDLTVPVSRQYIPKVKSQYEKITLTTIP